MLCLAAALAGALTPEHVLVVVNRESPLSQRIAQYYVHKRLIPVGNVVTIRVGPQEEISRADYAKYVEQPIAAFLKTHHLEEKILYIVTTLGVPLKIAGDNNGLNNDAASVDSELAALYARMKGIGMPLPGPARNPFFNQISAEFVHPAFPLYLVTRLAGYDFADVQAMIDRAMAARDAGKVVIDVRADNNTPGNDWLRHAASLVPKERLVLDDSARVLTGEKDVIAYAAWGSNDPDRTQRMLGFHWLPGAIVTEYVSTNARTFQRPPAAWSLGTWKDPSTWFAGAPQTLSADYIHEGATGCSGHVYEPYLHLNPRPDILIPQYLSGRDLAQSYYVSMPAISWQNVVLGDPLCMLRK